MPWPRKSRVPGLSETLIPALTASTLVGVPFGPALVGLRLDFGVGALYPTDSRGERSHARGVGYLMNFGPAGRLLLLRSSFIELAVSAELTWMRLGTTRGCVQTDCSTPGSGYPQLGVHALAPGVALQVAFRHLLIEMRYVRPYWYRYMDEDAHPSSVRDWNLMRADQIIISFGAVSDPPGRALD